MCFPNYSRRPATSRQRWTSCWCWAFSSRSSFHVRNSRVDAAMQVSAGAWASTWWWGQLGSSPYRGIKWQAAIIRGPDLGLCDTINNVGGNGYRSAIIWKVRYIQRPKKRRSNRARQLYKNISMLFLFPVKDGKLSTGVNATFDASCYG